MAGKKIVMADDDWDDKSIIKDAMALMSQEDVVHFTDNGEETLALLERLHTEENLPCLIVLDLNMPRMNGSQTLKLLKQDLRFQEIPVIIYSTSINPLEQEKCLRLGAYAYITKPVSFKESMDTARSFLTFCEPAVS